MREWKELEAITKKKSLIFTEYYSWYNVIQAVYETDQIPKYKDKNLRMMSIIDWLLNDKTGTRNLRVIFDKGISRSKITKQTKWIGWSGVYSMATRCNLNAYFGYLTYKYYKEL